MRYIYSFTHEFGIKEVKYLASSCCKADVYYDKCEEELVDKVDLDNMTMSDLVDWDAIRKG